MQAMYQMKKIIIADIERAYRGGRPVPHTIQSQHATEAAWQRS